MEHTEKHEEEKKKIQVLDCTPKGSRTFTQMKPDNGNCELNARHCVLITVTKSRPNWGSLAKPLNPLPLTMLSDNVLLGSLSKLGGDDYSRSMPEVLRAASSLIPQQPIHTVSACLFLSLMHHEAGQRETSVWSRESFVAGPCKEMGGSYPKKS